jgi:hypothetical protein
MPAVRETRPLGLGLPSGTRSATPSNVALSVRKRSGAASRSVCWLLWLAFPLARADPDPALPQCLATGNGESIRLAVMRAERSPQELLARLAYAEALSTGFPDEPAVYEAIAWGVMNRLRLGERSPAMGRRYGSTLAGVIFKPGQFNPAISARSPFSKQFLCARDSVRWDLSRAGARKALSGRGNPFIQTGWERSHGLSLVVNFYYPGSPQSL